MRVKTFKLQKKQEMITVCAALVATKKRGDFTSLFATLKIIMFFVVSYYKNIFLTIGILSKIIAMIIHITKRRIAITGTDNTGANDSESNPNQRSKCSITNGWNK